MSKSKRPPKAATLAEQLRWYLRHCETAPVEVARQAGIHHTTVYRFLSGKRTLSSDATDRLARHLRLRLAQDKR